MPRQDRRDAAEPKTPAAAVVAASFNWSLTEPIQTNRMTGAF
jgi:hypothetical protein